MLRFLTIACVALCSCQWLIRPGTDFEKSPPPPEPDYSLRESWAALPDRADTADSVPSEADWKDAQSTASADVFFVHPTLYFGGTWNADVADATVNRRVDETTLRKQASVFNCCARIYAPRYRQATIAAFLDKKNGAPALDLAYSDVLRAFDYYMIHYNQGRPVIIASHSQGTRHAYFLLKDRFDRKPALSRLVAAYLIGMAIPEHPYATIPICKSATEVQCFITYRSATPGTELKRLPHDPEPPYACTNPIHWKSDDSLAEADLNPGGVSANFEKVDPNVCSAQCQNGVLLISKPKESGYHNISGNFHVSDYSLFYVSIRKNMADRIAAFR